MTSVQSTQHGISADGSTLQKTGNTLSIKDDGVTTAKLNADIVGIATATGKINAINTTNFSSLDGVNLTNTGDLVLIEAVTQASAATTMDSGTLDLTAYRTVIIDGVFDLAGSAGMLLRINSDNTGANYDGGHSQIDTAGHASDANTNALNATSATRHFIHGVIRMNASGAKDCWFIISDGAASNTGDIRIIRYDQTDAVTVLGFGSAQNINDTSKFEIYGIKT